MSFLRKILRRDGVAKEEVSVEEPKRPIYVSTRDRASKASRRRAEVDPELKERVLARRGDENSRRERAIVELSRKNNVFLTQDDLVRVHMLSYCGYSASQIVEIFPVHVSTIYAILAGRTHGEIKNRFETCLGLLMEE